MLADRIGASKSIKLIFYTCSYGYLWHITKAAIANERKNRSTIRVEHQSKAPPPLLGVLLKTNKHVLTEADIDILAKDTDGFSGADLKSLCTDAAMGPIRQLGAKAMDIDVNDVPPISYKHFKKSLKGTRPSVAPSDLKQYIEWDESYGTTRHDEEEEEED